MIDDLTVLRSFLLNDTALAAEIGTRLYAGRNTPIEGWKPSDGACITMKRRGGGQDESGAMVTTSFQFKCYGTGATPSAQVYSANQVYRKLRDALNYQGSLAVAGAQEEGRGSTFGLEDGEENYPFVLCFFRAQLRETTL